MTSPRLFLVAGVLAVGLVPASSNPAEAQKKPKVQRACGISTIPLTVGNTWTYEPVAHPATQDPENPLREGWDRLNPNQPTKVVVTVSAIDTVDGVTTIKLDETVSHLVKGDHGKTDKTVDRTLQTTMTCTATTLSASPDSFWFAGEPGGAWNATVAVTERKGHGFPIVTGKLDGTEWHDDVAATWKREPTKGTDAKLGEGKLSLERRVVLISDTEAVGTTSGSYTKATKIGIETHGQITIDGTEGKPYELPEGLYSFYWLVDGVGVVLVHNGYLQAYQLSSFTVAK